MLRSFWVPFSLLFLHTLAFDVGRTVCATKRQDR